jgi:hypothetical protein
LNGKEKEMKTSLNQRYVLQMNSISVIWNLLNPWVSSMLFDHWMTVKQFKSGLSCEIQLESRMSSIRTRRVCVLGFGIIAGRTLS